MPRFRMPYRLLVVDDDPDTTSTMRVLLRLLGGEVQTASDGAEALKIAAEFRPHAVLLDIAMPKLHGYNAARQLRQEDWGRDLVLVALTGWSREEDRRQSQQAGFDAHLTKPVQILQLRNLLQDLFDRRFAAG